MKKSDNISEWDLAAKNYAEFSSSSPYSIFCKEFVANYFGRFDNQCVLDLGCGPGEYTELFRSRGGNVIGCDGSSVMLKLANREYPRCTFKNVNLLEKLPFANEQFDLVFCSLALMDINPIDSLIAEVSRIMKPSARFFFNIVHPAFCPAKWMKDDTGTIISKNISVYLTSYTVKQDFCGGTTHYHRPLSYHLNLMAKNNLSLMKMYEPTVYEDSKIPDIPLYLFAEYQKIPFSKVCNQL